MKLSMKIFFSVLATGSLAYAIIWLGKIPRMGTFAIIILSALFLSIISYVSIIKPIRKLNSSIENISKGDLDTKIDPVLLKRRDDLGELAQSFDRVLISLKYAVDMVGISKEKLRLGEMIEEKKETERRLKLTEEFLNNIIENIGIPVIAYNKKGELLLANKKFTEVTGYTKEDIILFEKFKSLALPSKMVSDKFIKTLAQFHKGEDIDNFVLPIRCKNNTTITVVCNIVALKDARGLNDGEALFMRNLNDIFSLEKEIRYWAANGFVQEREEDHHHRIEISETRGERRVKTGKNRHKRIR